MVKHEFLLFDLDGTLSDPLIGISRSINHALLHFGYPERATQELAAFIGPPLDQTFEVLTGTSSQAHLQELVAKYRERYGDIGYAENTIYDGIATTLEQLHAAQMPMAVCTSKRADFAEKIIAMFGLAEYFAFMSGGEIGIHKWQQLEQLRLEKRVPASTVMIGDRNVDLIAASKNNLAGAGVLWGYGSEAELLAEKPNYMHKHPKEWLGFLK